MEKDKQPNLPDLIKQLEQILGNQKTQVSTQDLKTNFEPGANLGRVIKRTRGDQKISQKQLAALSGLSALTITKLEAGNRRVSLENVEKVLSALGKTIWIK